MNILPLFFTISSMWKFLRCTSKLLEAASRKLNAQRFDNPTSVTWARWPFLEMFIGIYTHNHPGGTIPVYLNRLAPVSRRPGRFVALDQGLWIAEKRKLYIMLVIMYIYIYIHRSKYIYVYFEGLQENHVMLTSFALTCMVGAARSQPKFLRKLGPNFQNTGLEIEPRFPAKPLCRKSVPNLGRSWRESSLQPFGCKLVRLQLGQIQVASAAIHLHLLHGHRPRSRPDQIQNPKSKLQTARLDFGFWILDFGFWILDFGFWILDFGFWILDFGFRILDFGFWISDFGVWILEFGSV